MSSKFAVLIAFITQLSYAQPCEDDRSRRMERGIYFDHKWVKKALDRFDEVESRFQFNEPRQKIVFLAIQNKMSNVGGSINIINLTDSSLELFAEYSSNDRIRAAEQKTYPSSDSAYIKYRARLKRLESSYFLQQNLSKKQLKRGYYDSEFIFLVMENDEIIFMMVGLNGTFFKDDDINYPNSDVKMLTARTQILHVR